MIMNVWKYWGYWVYGKFLLVEVLHDYWKEFKAHRGSSSFLLIVYAESAVIHAPVSQKSVLFSALEWSNQTAVIYIKFKNNEY